MKKLASLLSFVLFGVLCSGCSENLPTQALEKQDRSSVEAESYSLVESMVLGKGHKCTPWPDCKDGDNSSGWITYSVTVVPAVTDNDLESFCYGETDIKLSAIWFTHSCNTGETPFLYTPTNAPQDFFAGNGSIVIDLKKMTYRFWLWTGDSRSDAYETGTQDFEATDMNTNSGTGVITLQIRRPLRMCLNQKRSKGCVGNVNFGDIVYTPI